MDRLFEDAVVECPHAYYRRQHLGFGWGLHLCVGAPLARMEARVTFERLLARTRSFAVAPGARLSHHRSLMIRRLSCLPLNVVPAPDAGS